MDPEYTVVDRVKPAVLGECADCLMEKKVVMKTVKDCGSEEQSDGLALFRPDISVDSSEGCTAGKNASADSNADVTKRLQ